MKRWLPDDRNNDTPWLPRSLMKSINDRYDNRAEQIVIAVAGSNSMHFEVSTSTLYSDHCYYHCCYHCCHCCCRLSNLSNLETRTRCLHTSRINNHVKTNQLHDLSAILSVGTTCIHPINVQTWQYESSAHRVISVRES